MRMRTRPGLTAAQAAKKRKKKLKRAAEAARTRTKLADIEDIDYKNTGLLQRLVSAQGKAFSRKRTGLEAAAQRRVTIALKRARFVALMPYVT